MRGIIADIQRASVHDGPGLRTTVFFKGCPLRCRWCHNPECISFEPQILYYPEKCIGCGHCAEGCYSGARVLCGKSLTAEDVMAQILLDRPYYGREGGVTFSGGEPMAQLDFLRELAGLCRRAGIHRAIETSLFIFDAEILRSMDVIMADLKLWDREKHLAYTGVSNDGIIENFRKLDGLNVPFIMRTPVIKGVTDMDAVAAFARSLKNMVRHEQLPYHPLGIAKAEALGMTQERFE